MRLLSGVSCKISCDHHIRIINTFTIVIKRECCVTFRRCSNKGLGENEQAWDGIGFCRNNHKVIYCELLVELIFFCRDSGITYFVQFHHLALYDIQYLPFIWQTFLLFKVTKISSCEPSVTWESVGISKLLFIIIFCPAQSTYLPAQHPVI